MEVYYQLLRTLKKECPCDYPAKVRRVKTSDLGYCLLKGDHYLIHISKDSEEDLAIQTLIHEWSHALTWDSWQTTGQHCLRWGKAYSRVYSAYLRLLDRNAS